MRLITRLPESKQAKQTKQKQQQQQQQQDQGQCPTLLASVSNTSYNNNNVSAASGMSMKHGEDSGGTQPKPLPTIEPLPRMPRHEFYPGSEAPVFYPTMEEFEDFERFIHTIQPLAINGGVAKVVPPKEWREKLESETCKRHPAPLRDPIQLAELEAQRQQLLQKLNTMKRDEIAKGGTGESCDELTAKLNQQTGMEESSKLALFDKDCLRIVAPIIQSFSGTKGVYIQDNVEHIRPEIPILEHFEDAVARENAVPDYLVPKLKRTSASSLNPQQQQQQQQAISVDSNPDSPSPEEEFTSTCRVTTPSNRRARRLESTFGALSSSITACDPSRNYYRTLERDKSGIIVDFANGTVRPCIEARRRYNKGSIMDFRSVSQGAEPLDETETAGSIVEKNYWNDIKRTRPTYGADILGSLFPPPEDFKYWNLQDLGTILSRVNVELAGINDPYLYVGMYRATFAWHTEDLDLYSINYVHYGSPKSWFAIPIKYCTKFEAFARSKFPEKADRCSEFMRHKTFHINPDVLEKAGIPVQRMVQNAGEFVITFPRGYHAGFNQGFNVAEAVNFAMPEWVPIGAWAKFCLCQQDSVRIDVRQFFPVPDEMRDPMAQYVGESYMTTADLISPPPQSQQSQPPPSLISTSNGTLAGLRQSSQLQTPPMSPVQLDSDGDTVEVARPARSRTLPSARTAPAVVKLNLSEKDTRRIALDRVIDSLPFRLNAFRTRNTLGNLPSSNKISTYSVCHVCHQAITPACVISRCSGMGCSQTVHTRCFSTCLPDGWMCFACLSGYSALPCILCPYNGGPMKVLINTDEALPKLPFTYDGLPIAKPEEDETTALMKTRICGKPFVNFAHALCVRFMHEIGYLPPLPDSQSAAVFKQMHGITESSIIELNESNSNSYMENDIIVLASSDEEDNNAQQASRRPGVYSTDELNEIKFAAVGLNKIPYERCSAKCSICHKSSAGYTVLCAHPDCEIKFHVTCALIASKCLNQSEDGDDYDDGDSIVGDDEDEAEDEEVSCGMGRKGQGSNRGTDVKNSMADVEVIELFSDEDDSDADGDRSKDEITASMDAPSIRWATNIIYCGFHKNSTLVRKQTTDSVERPDLSLVSSVINTKNIPKNIPKNPNVKNHTAREANGKNKSTAVKSPPLLATTNVKLKKTVAATSKSSKARTQPTSSPASQPPAKRRKTPHTQKQAATTTTTTTTATATVKPTVTTKATTKATATTTTRRKPVVANIMTSSEPITLDDDEDDGDFIVVSTSAAAPPQKSATAASTSATSATLLRSQVVSNSRINANGNGRPGGNRTSSSVNKPSNGNTSALSRPVIISQQNGGNFAAPAATTAATTTTATVPSITIPDSPTLHSSPSITTITTTTAASNNAHQ